MATQFTDILKLAKPVQGELTGTWGTVVNDNVTAMVEEAIAGRAVINSWVNNSATLSSADGTTASSRAAMLTLTDTSSALTAATTVICPAKTKLFVVHNTTGQPVTLKTAGGTGIQIPINKAALLFCDGTNVLEAVTNMTTLSIGGKVLSLAGNLTTSGISPLTLTTTGSTNVTLPTTDTLATTAGTETFTNKTLTSPTINGGNIASLTTALPVAAGGTGAGTPAAALTALGGINALVQDTSPQLGGTLDVNSNPIEFGTTQARFGQGNTLTMAHTGNAFLINGTGSFGIQTNNEFRVSSADSTEIMLVATKDGGVSLRHNNVEKVATTTGGISVTGDIGVNGTVDGVDISVNVPSTLGSAGQNLTVNAAGNAGAWADATYKGFVKLGATTATNAVTNLTTDGGSPTTTNQILIPLNSGVSVDGTLMMRRQTQGGAASAVSLWRITALVRRENSGVCVVDFGTVTVVSNAIGYQNPTLLAAGVSAAGIFQIQVTGESGQDLRWSAELTTAEVIYAA